MLGRAILVILTYECYYCHWFTSSLGISPFLQPLGHGNKNLPQTSKWDDSSSCVIGMWQKSHRMPRFEHSSWRCFRRWLFSRSIPQFFGHLIGVYRQSSICIYEGQEWRSKICNRVFYTARTWLGAFYFQCHHLSV